MNVFLRVLVAGGMIMAPAVVQAGLILNVISAWPSTPAVQTAASPTTPTTQRGIDAGRNPFQTFQVAADFQLDKVYIGYQGAVASQTFTVRMFTVADVNLEPPTSMLAPGDAGYTGSILFIESVTLPATGLPSSAATMEFDLTDASEVMLTASTGTTGYAFQILGDGDSAHPLEWKLTASGQGSIYAGGRFYEGPLATRSSFLPAHRDAALAIVPEPSSIILLAFGSIMIMAHVRQRRAC
jgi:hypothetical protein